MKMHLGIASVLICISVGAAPDPSQPSTQWYRGNTHTHTLWSDGDGPPEMVTAWYRDREYDFLVLSDHNILSEGEKWYPVGEGGKLTAENVASLRRTYGADWVRTRQRGNRLEMRLKTLAELRDRFEASGEFLLIQGEEITDEFENLPVHLNGLNLAEYIPPQGGDSVREVLQRNIDAVIAQGTRLDRPVLTHVNHPNFGWALTAEDIASIAGERFFEIYNGHSGVRNYGDADHPGVEQMWDIALSLRLNSLDLGILYGLATDDAHSYYKWGVGNPNPGRGWVMVRAEALEADAVVRSLRAGEFYASSGVFLNDFKFDGRRFEISIRAEPGVHYTTQFIGQRRYATGMGTVGEWLAVTTENPAVYEMQGNEVYVRARVMSSRPHPNPYAAEDRECAWVQPVLP